MKYRTDLAIERKELLDEARGSAKDIEGVSLEKIKYDDCLLYTSPSPRD